MAYDRSEWCGKGWLIRAYYWHSQLHGALYRGHRCPLGRLTFANEEELHMLVQDLGAKLTMVSDARHIGEITETGPVFTPKPVVTAADDGDYMDRNADI